MENSKLINFGNFIGDVPEHEPYISVSLALESVKPNQNFPNTQLAVRVTLVNYIGEIVLDTLVKPPKSIQLQSMAKIHGLTPAYYDQGRSFTDVQRFIQKVLKGKLLIGTNTRRQLELLNLKNQPFVDVGFQTKEAVKPTNLKRQAVEELNASLDYHPSCTIVDARIQMALFKKKKVMYSQFIEGATEAQLKAILQSKQNPQQA